MEKIKEFFADKTSKMTKNDWIILVVITLIYAVISFIRLGSFTNPQTFSEYRQGESIIIEVEGDAKYISKMRHFAGEDTGTYKLSVSTDGEEYNEISTVKDGTVFFWKDTTINEEVKYIKLELETNIGYIGEIGLYDQDGNLVELTAVNEKDKMLVDEQDTIPEVISHMNSTYFDEVYFPRTAYDYLHGMKAYEWVHPPLGKLIQMIPMIFMGMTPFAYRLMGNLAGILMVAVMYVFGKSMFKDSKYALLAGLIMAFDNFHFAQTRMGTVDSFLVLFIMLSALFMYKYLLLNKEDPLKQKLKYLFYSGLFFGCSVAVKWTGLYAGLGLCIMFFGKMIKDCIKDRKFDKQYIYIILACVLYFILIPCTIHVVSYLAFPNIQPNGVYSIGDIFKQIEKMYTYHSTLVAEHPFTSNWYTWPVMQRPVWLHVSYPAEGLKSTIVGLGNPAIWWVGIIGMIFVMFRTIKNTKMEDVFLTIMILTSWLPYALIGRIMFMYHFFPTLPFVMLTIVALIQALDKLTKRNWIMIAYIILIIVMFWIFYPVTSGVTMTIEQVKSFLWLKTWYF